MSDKKTVDVKPEDVQVKSTGKVITVNTKSGQAEGYVILHYDYSDITTDELITLAQQEAVRKIAIRLRKKDTVFLKECLELGEKGITVNVKDLIGRQASTRVVKEDLKDAKPEDLISRLTDEQLNEINRLHAEGKLKLEQE